MLAKDQTPNLFDKIAKNYDRLNHIFSLGLDLAWRRAAAQHLPRQAGLTILDVATGTGDQLVALERRAAKPCKLMGLDPSPGMLGLCSRKMIRLGINGMVQLQSGKAESLPLETQSVDVITTSFGIRNFPNPQAALREFHRVLKPGGRVIVLELSLPAQPWLRIPYLFYFRRVLPWLGGLISGERGAYSYLNQSVERFPQGREFCAWLENSGFINVNSRLLTLGIASLYVGGKPAA
jgi:demethylmenaquinone methyltransferase/2-methoxy-6-polyprenyl-1,4-benzoquinol methylase